MKWFKHQSDARNSLKLRKVRRKYGANGYAIYWFCLEAIAYDVDKDNLTFDLKEDTETIGFELGIQESIVAEIMHYMVDIGLFESLNNVITCLKLAESMDKSMTNSPKMRQWLELKASESVMTSPDNANTCAELEVELEEEKIKDNSASPKVDACPYQQILEIYHEVLPMVPAIAMLTSQRKTKIKNFWNKFKFNLDSWNAYLTYIKTNCTWMTEARPNGNGGMWKAKNLEYFVTEKCYLSVKEDRASDQ